MMHPDDIRRLDLPVGNSRRLRDGIRHFAIGVAIGALAMAAVYIAVQAGAARAGTVDPDRDNRGKIVCEIRAKLYGGMCA